ncbi:pilus assembly protein TadG [Caulobacter sp. SLTY]|uniref:pilus assembly protein TadG-related protein n=1 Tax=Caulobacter sp. SLTY TaxID=2683262 RepID=UPI001411DC09|nr:pilus assembly protein TadG-related protein [Caulobacter sp. SLTY]NBB16877.1 pilus assembly protein TadG [Caulobacter sp. SLTY]
MVRVFKPLLRRQDGNVAITVAIGGLVLAVLVFGLLDVNRASTEKRSLQDALDAAAIYAARSKATTDAEIQVIGQRTLVAQLGTLQDARLVGSTFKLTGNGGAAVSATAQVEVKPIIANLWLQRDMLVGAKSEVLRSMNKIELALVLDNTGSMSGSKLTNLKVAAKNLIDTLAASAARSAEPNPVKIGIVPFSQAVKVGSAYRSQSWIDQSGAAPINKEIFFDRATGAAVNANRFTLLSQMGVSWGGCVETRAQPYDVQDTAPTTGTPATLYTPYFAPDEPDSRSKSGNANGDFGNFANDYLPDEQFSASDWRIPQGFVGKYDQAPTGSGRGPNRGCDMQPIMRLTNNWSGLKSLVDGMVATGNTNIPLGAAWGWNLLSPAGPFSDGAAYGTPKLSKIMLIMTDGDNVMSTAGNDNESNYNSLGYIWQGRLGITNGGEGARTNRMDKRLELLCQNAKAKGVIIYTVRVEVKTGASPLLRNCATSPDRYFDVQDSDELNNVFQTIAGEISNLRISR